MKPFENAKDFLLVLRVDADAVVLHGKAPGRALIDRGDMDLVVVLALRYFNALLIRF